MAERARGPHRVTITVDGAKVAADGFANLFVARAWADRIVSTLGGKGDWRAEFVVNGRTWRVRYDERGNVRGPVCG